MALGAVLAAAFNRNSEISLMSHWFKQLDQLLRGEKTRPAVLQQDGFDIRVGGLVPILVLLFMCYGLCMGSFSLLKEIPPDVQESGPPYMQLVATTIKVPILFTLTLLITLPSLYVLNALVGSRLSILNLVRLLIASLAINATVLASMGPIVLFFSLSTKSYSFIVLLNVVVYTVAGILGLLFLMQTLHRLTVIQELEQTPELPITPGDKEIEQTPQAEGEEFDGEETDEGGELIESEELNLPVAVEVKVEDEHHPLEMPAGQVLAKHTRFVFRCWVVLFALVGAQMGWVLRPFVGSPGIPFTWFRERESNFFTAVIRALFNLLTGG